jgi:hypothetical protein
MYYWTKDIVIDPNDVTQNTWYACVFSGWGGAPNGLGGLYKTINRGASWTKLTGTTIDRVTSITFNPTNPNQIYLTSETQGLWISNNINSTTPVFSNVSSYPFQQPERVFFNPYNTSELWVSSFGNGMKMGTLLTTGIPHFEPSKEELTMYPNPSTGMITLINSNAKQVFVYNAVGEVVATFQMAVGANQIDLSALAEGMYIIECGTQKSKVLLHHD